MNVKIYCAHSVTVFMNDRLPIMPILPIYDILPALKTKLHTHNLIILQAPPGAGKSTVLPLELLNETWLGSQQILMLEPRRLAARTVAARMASQRRESVGQTVGYRVRFESRVSAQTRIEIVTEGILTRRLQHDSSLDGVGLIIFDEFHERSLHADLALALCREIQTELRDDLRILIMSATLDGETLAKSLRSNITNPIPILTALGRQFPVEMIYTANYKPGTPIHTLVADGVARALTEQTGDVLAFLPGIAEIQRAQTLLEAQFARVQFCPLYGELSLEAQRAAIVPNPNGQRKVVLATLIAETSLTIEGIKVVVDCGYARLPRFDPPSGLTRLETQRITLDSAEQRAGRAGRLGPGVCYRLWDEQTHKQLLALRKPEILEADLAPMRLELAQWGVKSCYDVAWVTPPPSGAVQQAETLLNQLDAMQGHFITERGRNILNWATHPRLAHMLIESQKSQSGQNSSQPRQRAMPALAADVAALLEERDPLPRSASADLTLRIEALRQWRKNRRVLHNADEHALGRVAQVADQWLKQFAQHSQKSGGNAHADNGEFDPQAVGWLVAQVYPDRIAQIRNESSRLATTRYRLSGGRGAQLPADDPLSHEQFLAVAQLDMRESDGRIFLAAPMFADQMQPLTRQHDVLAWDARQGLLVARREWRVGEWVLTSQPLSQISTAQRVGVLCDVLRREGLELLCFSDKARQWQARLQSLRLWRPNEAWQDVSDQALLDNLEIWVGSSLNDVSKRDDFAKINVLPLLENMLTYKQRTHLDALAPTHLDVPSGSNVRLTYSADGTPPVLAVKLQEMFGLEDTPTVNEGRTKVMLHLLSPAQRPIQVTQDLRSFWANTYPMIRKELRGRYNKHPWPEDPWNAVATKRTVKRVEQT